MFCLCRFTLMNSLYMTRHYSVSRKLSCAARLGAGLLGGLLVSVFLVGIIGDVVG